MSKLSLVCVVMAFGAIGLLIGASAYERYDDTMHPFLIDANKNCPPEQVRRFNEEKRVEREMTANQDLLQSMLGSGMLLCSLLVFVVAACIRRNTSLPSPG